MAKRIVALYAAGADENAFSSRARKATQEVLPFSNGIEFLNSLRVFSRKGNIDDLRIHSHGFSGGIIARDFDGGVYTQEYKNSVSTAQSIATYDISGTVYRGEVKFSQNANIVLYGCNNSILALELCRYLGLFPRRRDISVTGADNSVYESNGTAKVDRKTTGISNGARGKFHTYKGGALIKSVESVGYR